MPRPRSLKELEKDALALQAEYEARKRLDQQKRKTRKPKQNPNPPHRFGVLVIPPKVILRTGAVCASLVEE